MTPALASSGPAPVRHSTIAADLVPLTNTALACWRRQYRGRSGAQACPERTREDILACAARRSRAASSRAQTRASRESASPPQPKELSRPVLVRRTCRERIDAPEWFDQARLTPVLVARYLHDLEKVNRYLLGTRSVLVHLVPLLTDGRGGPLRVLDLGCGGGEVLRALAVRARKRRRPLLGIGLDRNPLVVAYARYRARAFPELSWVCADISALPFAPGSMDAVISTTIMHHLDPARVVDVLRRARAVARDWLIISDLIRSYAALAAYRVFSRLARFHESTRYDGQVSVRRAYRPEEFARLAAAAGLTHWRLHRHPFDRMTLVVGPPEEGDASQPRGRFR